LLWLPRWSTWKNEALICRERGGWQPTVALEEIDLGVPESLSRTIEAQIERLSIEEQRALEVASLQSVAAPGSRSPPELRNRHGPGGA